MADTSIQSGPSGIKEKEISRDWPVVKGSDFGTTKQEGDVSNLVVQEKSLVSEEEKKGL